MTTDTIIDILGWLGVAGLLVAYGLVSTRKTSGDSLLYQGINLASAALLGINSFYYGAFPSVGINVVWIGIAIYTLARRRTAANRPTTP